MMVLPDVLMGVDDREPGTELEGELSVGSPDGLLAVRGLPLPLLVDRSPSPGPNRGLPRVPPDTEDGRAVGFCTLPLWPSTPELLAVRFSSSRSSRSMLDARLEPAGASVSGFRLGFGL